MENYESYGTEAEKVVLEYLNNIGFDVRHNDSKEEEYNGLSSNYHKRTQTINKTGLLNYQYNNRFSEKVKMTVVRNKYGDIEIPYQENILKMDVVRGTWISHSALNKFMGEFYCIFPEGDISNPENGRVIRKRTIENFNRTCLRNGREDEIISNKPGFRYNKVKAFMTLKDFGIHMTKMMLLNHRYGTKEFYSDLKYPFIKDYIKQGTN